MYETLLNKSVEVKLAFSTGFIDGGSIPQSYKGVVVEIDDENIKLRITHKKKETTMIINKKFVIYLIEL